MKHKDRRDPKDWKGFKLAVPFDYSMHNYLLRYFLAEHGLDPDTDVQIRSVPPPEMVANLRADNIDGFLAPDPVNQRAVYDGVGFIHTLSKELWAGHPCCAFAASREFVTQSPNTYAALLKAIIDATAFASKPENRKQIAEAIAPANYLNQPVTVVEQVLTGTYADGLGNVKRDAARIDFDPFPYESFAVWILTQMKRWGQIKGDIDYAGVAKQVFLATDTTRLHEGSRTHPACLNHQELLRDGQSIRCEQARRLHRLVQDQADLNRCDSRVFGPVLACGRGSYPSRSSSSSALPGTSPSPARARRRCSTRNTPSSWARRRRRANLRCRGRSMFSHDLEPSQAAVLRSTARTTRASAFSSPTPSRASHSATASPSSLRCRSAS